VNIKLEEELNQQVLLAFFEIMDGLDKADLIRMTGLREHRATEIVDTYLAARYGIII
jgi:hypothetical protein